MSSFVNFSAQGDMIKRKRGCVFGSVTSRETSIGLLSTWQYYDNMASKQGLSLSTFRGLLERRGLPDVILTWSDQPITVRDVFSIYLSD